MAETPLQSLEQLPELTTPPTAGPASGVSAEPTAQSLGDFASQFASAIVLSRPQPAAEGEAMITVSGPLHRLTALYERVRTLIDYQEERFIRRLAIRRILSRRLLIEHAPQDLGLVLIKELIRAAYLAGGTYPVRAAAEIDQLLGKYVRALPLIERQYTAPEYLRMQRRLLGIAAAEIEDHLQPSQVELLLVERLAIELADHLGGPVNDSIRLVALRGFLKADAELITWRLVGQSNQPSWQAFVAGAEGADAVLGELARLEVLVNHSELERKVRQYRFLLPPYRLLADLAAKRPGEVPTLVAEPHRLRFGLDELVAERLAATRGKIRRSIIQATLYIFLTKVIVGLAVEIPYDQFVAGVVAYGPLAINLLTPPLLMLAATFGIQPPSRTNTERLLDRTEAIVRGQPLPPHPDVGTRRRFAAGRSSLFTALYLLTYVLVFGGIVSLLDWVGFNAGNILIFLFFVSIVGFFAFRIRATAKELAVRREREGLLLPVLDFFSLPFLQAGRWLSLTARQLNVVLFVMDFLIEAPFKVFVLALEDWVAFLRQKREELH